MNCERFEESLAASLTGSLSGRESQEIESHAAVCAACRAQSSEVRKMWENLGLLPAGEPGPAVRARFYEMLEAYKHGLEQAALPLRERVNRWLTGWWPSQPVWQTAVAALCLAAGLVAGYALQRTEKENPRLAQMSEEIRSMRQLVTLSLLQQQSASDRLRGVSWSYRLEGSDSEVLSALLHTMNSDANVNVRLAAVDALYKFSDSGMVRGALRQSLPSQSPIVQIALIDMLGAQQDPQTASVFREVLKAGHLDPNVRQRLEKHVGRLPARVE